MKHWGWVHARDVAHGSSLAADVCEVRGWRDPAKPASQAKHCGCLLLPTLPNLGGSLVQSSACESTVKGLAGHLACLVMEAMDVVFRVHSLHGQAV